MHRNTGASSRLSPFVTDFRHRSQLITARFSLALLLLALAACAPSPEDDHTGRENARSILIATDATFPPFHYLDDNGDATGFDVELASELARRAGYVPQTVILPYARLFDDLLAGRYQVVAATTGITSERERKFLFTTPYFDTCQAVLVRTGDGEPQSIAGLAGRRVGAAGSGTSMRALDKLPGSIPVRLGESQATEGTIRDDGSVPVLENGHIDALIVDEFDAVDAARASNGKLDVLSEPLALEQYALVLAPGDAGIKRELDAALFDMQADGSLAALRRNFGLDRDDDWPVDLSQGQ